MRNLLPPKTRGYCSAGFESAPPASNQHLDRARNVQKHTNQWPNENAQIPRKGEKAECSCLRSLRAVLRDHCSYSSICIPISQPSPSCSGNTHTTVPANTPAKHRNITICQIALLSPNKDVATARPARLKTRTGLRPIRSAARPQEIIRSIWVRENIDSFFKSEFCLGDA